MTKRKHKIQHGRIVRDIAQHGEFARLRHYDHHNSSIYEHARRVSYYSYRLCHLLGLDYHAGARGGMLHDFFLYDWRSYKKDKNNPNHGRTHPLVALDNSRRCFPVSDTETDIIRHHMWPKGSRRPQSPEGMVVSMVDKYCAAVEFLQHGMEVTRRRYRGVDADLEQVLARYPWVHRQGRS